MFLNYKKLNARERRSIIITVLIMVIPVCVYVALSAHRMAENKASSMRKYEERFEVSQERLDLLTGAMDSTQVRVGMYMESITDISVRENQWNTLFLVWFRWEGDMWSPSAYPGETFFVGNGQVLSRHLIEEYHKDGVHYQQYRVHATIEKYFDTTRYPLDSHQLKVFIEDHRDISEIRYVADTKNSALSPYLNVAGFDVLGYDCGIYLNEYPTDMAHPLLEQSEYDGKKTMEYVFATRVNRDGYALFLKAFLSLLGILLWVCIGLYNCAYNQTDAMGAINTGIFGVVSSLIVGMNLLSDARTSGLIEFINFFSLAMILMITLFVIRLNRYRVRDYPECFTTCYAKSLFWISSVLSVATITIFIFAAAL